MKVNIEVTPKVIRQLIFDYIASKLGGGAAPDIERIIIKVRSKQNYRDKEFEEGEVRVTYEGDI